jgi:hypothetical protein
MSVKSFNFKFLAAIVVSVCTIFLLAAFVSHKSDGEVISKRVNIAIRAIGHDLLLRSGDSTSLVRPVIEKSNGVFLLEFENEFVFQPDTLVAIVQRLLSKTELSHYTVTVQECLRPAIVYGFEINPPDNSVVACRGRIQHKACYTIEITFVDFPDATVSYLPLGIVLGSIPIVFAFILIGRNFTRLPDRQGSAKSKPIPKQRAQVENEIKGPLIGKFVFDSTNQSLRTGEETILLTDKECKILILLNRNIGQTTLREELIQDVWTDEGVITGRSLDMFISKLRKKLSADPGLRITNIHGKGYRLEIVND